MPFLYFTFSISHTYFPQYLYLSLSSIFFSISVLSLTLLFLLFSFFSLLIMPLFAPSSISRLANCKTVAHFSAPKKNLLRRQPTDFDFHLDSLPISAARWPHTRQAICSLPVIAQNGRERQRERKETAEP